MALVLPEMFAQSSVSWQNVSCQSFLQIHLGLKNISQAVKDHLWDKHTDRIY